MIMKFFNLINFRHRVLITETPILTIFASSNEVLNLRPFIRLSVCQQDYANSNRPIILKIIHSKGTYLTYIAFNFQLYSLHSLDEKT